ncbi:MAG: hypothetical protein ABEI52_03705 [Halobacteriaceae archaeon]
MIPRRVTGTYCIGIGITMASMWIVFYVAGAIPELTSAPMEIGSHLIAEGLTASFLLAAGYGLFRSRHWATSVLLFALGMLLYTVINSAGYFAQRGELVMVGMFTLLTLTTGAFLLDLLRDAAVNGRETAQSGGWPYA